jgi:hypothetical protein
LLRELRRGFSLSRRQQSRNHSCSTREPEFTRSFALLHHRRGDFLQAYFVKLDPVGPHLQLDRHRSTLPRRISHGFDHHAAWAFPFSGNGSH